MVTPTQKGCAGLPPRAGRSGIRHGKLGFSFEAPHVTLRLDGGRRRGPDGRLPAQAEVDVRHAAGRKGTLLAQALRKQDERQDAAVVTQPLEPATQPAGEQVRVRELAHMDLMSHEDGQKHRAR